MAINRGVTVDGQLIPNANGVLYTPPSGANAATRAVITSCSSYANAATSGVSVYIVPSGGSASTANQMAGKAFALGEEYTWPELIGQSIEAGGSLTGNDGGNGGAGVNIVITVTEFTGDS